MDQLFESFFNEGYYKFFAIIGIFLINGLSELVSKKWKCVYLLIVALFDALAVFLFVFLFTFEGFANIAFPDWVEIVFVYSLPFFMIGLFVLNASAIYVLLRVLGLKVKTSAK